MSKPEADRWLQQSTEDGIAIAQLNRPPANALTVDFLLEIEEHCRRLGEDDTIRALILKGYDKVFSAGMDLKMLSTMDDIAAQDAVVNALNRAYGAMYAFPKPLVAATSGHAIAGGLFFLLAADYRIGVDGPAKYGLSEVRVGVAFPIAPLEIARAELSAPTARRLLLSGQPLNVSDALSAGILDEITSFETLEDAAIDKARSLASSPAAAYARVKRQLRGPVLDKISTAIDGKEPMLGGWFTPETTKAALAVLS